jgi:hypothetical protein
MTLNLTKRLVKGTPLTAAEHDDNLNKLETAIETGVGGALTTGTLAQFAATTSAQLAGVINDETGTGALVFATSPTLATPVLGTPASGTLTNCTGLPAAGVTGLGSLATLSALGSVTSAGAIGSTANLPIITTTAGALTVGSFGSGANTFCQGNDSRLSDARTPTAHNQAWSTITSTPTTLTGYGITDAQPLDADLTSIAALTTTSFGRSFLDRADAAGGRTLLGLGSLATQSGTFSGTSSGTNTGDQTIANTSNATSHTVTLSGSGGSLQLVEGANITLTTTGTSDTGVVTIASTGGTGVTDGDKGDITVSGSGATWTIDAGAVTLADLANLATQTVIGRNTGSTGVPEAVTLSQLLDWSTTTQGSVLFRGASTWTALAPGTVGQVLQSGGSGANPSWITASGGGNAQTANPLSQFAATTSAQLAGVMSDETGTGALVFATSPTLVTPALGTPSSGTLTSCTGLPVSTGVAGLGTGVATFLATPSSANLRAALTDEVGTGSAYFVGGALGTPASGTLTSCTGLPVSTGVSGLGTGVATFLATPSSANLAAAITDETGTGSLVLATSPTLVTPALGTPSSGTLTSCTGLPVSTGVAGLGTGVATFLATPSSANLRAALTDEVGTGSAYFVGGALGTPASGTLTSCTGLPVSTGVSGLGTGVATFLATPSSANLAAAITDETGTGSLVLATSPTLVTPALGTPSSGTLTNCTGLPFAAGVSSKPTTRSGYGITDAAANGAVTGTGITMSTARLLGRSTAATGAIEEITLGTNLSFSGTTLNATGGGSSDGPPVHIDASQFIPRTTNGAGIDSQETATNLVNRDYLTFDPAAAEFAQAWFAWPTGWATAKVTFYWKATSATGACVWSARLRVYTNGDADDSAFGTAVTATDTAPAANSHSQTVTTGITPSGTVTAGKLTCLGISRDATNGSDTLAVDAFLQGVLVEKAS